MGCPCRFASSGASRTRAHEADEGVDGVFLTEEKLFRRIQELDSHRYRDLRRLDEWQFLLDPRGQVGERPPVLTGAKTVRVGDRWSGRDLYAWLARTVAIPAEWAGRRVVGLFDFGTTGGGTNSGFESLLFVHELPYQGVDSKHQEVFFAPDAAGTSVPLCFRIWSGLDAGRRSGPLEHKIRRADMGWLDEDTDDLFYTSSAMLMTVRSLDPHSTDRIDLLRILDTAFRLIDWSHPGSDRFYESVRTARTQLRDGLDRCEKHGAVTAHCVGHTHIDVAWLWRLKHTREKAARSFSTVLRLMELFPEYIFLQTQPQLYDYVKQDYPEIYEGIRKRVAERRWEAGGAMWLEADCNLTSGESLVRQILFGTRFFQREFGQKCTYLWLPDVFGYSWALPQILKKSGIRSFMTTKISWNQYNRMPHDTFIWRGMDGSEILAHFVTTPEPGQRADRWRYTYNGQLTAETVQGAWTAYRDKEVNRELLIVYGYGDGGGGVNREMLEFRRRLDEMPGLARVIPGRADDYFARLEETVAAADGYVHTWDGELYLEYHRGTYTSQASNKRMNRKLELALRETEWLSVLSGLAAGGAERNRVGQSLRVRTLQEQVWQEQLNEGWKIVLRNQFHDIIPGSSIHEVYEDSRAEYAQASAIVERVWREAAGRLITDQVRSVAVFNSAGWRRSSLVRVSADTVGEGGHFEDETGEILAAQRVGGEWWVRTPEVKSLGVAGIRFAPGEPAQDASSFQLRDRGITTPYYILEWNDRGQLVRVYDRRFDREVLRAGARGNVLQVFEDKPLVHDAWDVDIFYQEKMREVEDLQGVETLADGPLAAGVRFSWRYGDSVITQDLWVYAHSPRIDFVTKVRWAERQQLLKVAFPVSVRATEATYDIQFGHTKRPTHWNTSWDQARFESVGHQWADIGEENYGVALANDCKYGYDIKDGILRLSLIKSAIHPDHLADQGDHEFTYSLIPHGGSWLDAGIARQAWDLNSPLRAETGRAGGTGSLFRISLAETMVDAGKLAEVMVDAVKPAEDEKDGRIVLRLHEFGGGRRRIAVDSDWKIRSWQECNLIEEPAGERSDAPFAFEILSFEIKTFLVEIEPDGAAAPPVG